jgi:hypothetical protein
MCIYSIKKSTNKQSYTKHNSILYYINLQTLLKFSILFIQLFVYLF